MRKLSSAASRKRFEALRRAGCKPQRHTLSDGTVVVTKKRGCDVRENNPNRPPKKWMRDCVRGVKKNSPSVTDPNAVCGDLWYNKMSESARRKAMKREENTIVPYAPNPIGGMGLILGLAIGGGLVYWWTTRDAKKEDENPTLPAAKTCTVTVQNLHEWLQAKSLPGLYLYTETTAPSLANLKANFGTAYPATMFEIDSGLVLVLKNGDFYTYDNQGNPVPAPQLRAEYCKRYGG